MFARNWNNPLKLYKYKPTWWARTTYKYLSVDRTLCNCYSPLKMFYHPIHQLLSGRSLHYEPCQMVHGAGIAFCKKGTRVVIVCCWCMPEFAIIFCYFLCICGWECKGFPKSKTCWQDSMKALRPSGLWQAAKYNGKTHTLVYATSM